jgi:SAM-dependent methyltransferase
MIRTLGPDKSRLLQIHGRLGRQTVFFGDQLAEHERPVIYDEEDRREADVKAVTDFARIDIEEPAFPAADGHFDLVIWNRELVTVKHLGPTVCEVRRVLRSGGMFVVAVPNLAALHNRLLLLAGRQPTTLHVGGGHHVRGFTIPAMTRFLHRDLGFQILRVTGVGLAPFADAVMPASLRGLSHTVIWAVKKPAGTRSALSARCMMSSTAMPSSHPLASRSHSSPGKA